jgi:hypothetical protein
MSLRKAKTLYCVTMISAALLLAVWGGILGCAAGALLLTGALPIYSAIGREFIAQGITRAADIIRGRNESS